MLKGVVSKEMVPYTQATKKNSEFLNYIYTVKEIQCHSNHSRNCVFELKKSNKKANPGI